MEVYLAVIVVVVVYGSVYIAARLTDVAPKEKVEDGGEKEVTTGGHCGQEEEN